MSTQTLCLIFPKMSGYSLFLGMQSQKKKSLDAFREGPEESLQYTLAIMCGVLSSSTCHLQSTGSESENWLRSGSWARDCGIFYFCDRPHSPHSLLLSLIMYGRHNLAACPSVFLLVTLGSIKLLNQFQVKFP